MGLTGAKKSFAFCLLWTVVLSPWEGGLCHQQNFSSPASTSSHTASTGLSLLPNPHNSEQSGRRIPKNSQAQLITRIRSLPKEKLNRYKLDAARHLQVNLVRCFHALSISREKVPYGVRVAAKRAIGAIQSGKFTPAIVNNLGVILQKGCQQQGYSAGQLQSILGIIMPHVPPPIHGQLENVLGFVSSNLVVVNSLLGNVAGVVPNLLGGVIKSLTNSLGAVTGGLNGTLGSIGILLGGVLG